MFTKVNVSYPVGLQKKKIGYCFSEKREEKRRRQETCSSLHVSVFLAHNISQALAGVLGASRHSDPFLYSLTQAGDVLGFSCLSILFHLSPLSFSCPLFTMAVSFLACFCSFFVLSFVSFYTPSYSAFHTRTGKRKYTFTRISNITSFGRSLLLGFGGRNGSFDSQWPNSLS